MNIKIKLITVSALVSITFAMPEKIQAMEKEEKVKGFCLKMNPGIIDPYENNNQHTANEEKNTNRALASLELEDSRAWEYAKWIGNGVVYASYVCAKAAPYLIELVEVAVPPQTTWEWLTQPINGRPQRVLIKESVTDGVKTAQFVSNSVLYVSANSALMDK